MEAIRTEIKTTKRKFFRQYVEILKPMLKVSKLEADVLAELLYQNNKRSYIKDAKDRFNLVFNYDTKREIEAYLGINPASFRVLLGNLRKAGHIGYSDIDEKLLVYPGDNFKFIYEFKIEGEE